MKNKIRLRHKRLGHPNIQKFFLCQTVDYSSKKFLVPLKMFYLIVLIVNLVKAKHCPFPHMMTLPMKDLIHTDVLGIAPTTNIKENEKRADSESACLLQRKCHGRCNPVHSHEQLYAYASRKKTEHLSSP